MSKYVNVDAFVEALCKTLSTLRKQKDNTPESIAFLKGAQVVAKELMKFPAADVIEKKHGYWIKRIIENEKEDYPIRNVDYICSRCEGCWHEPLKYCPMCLAEMDKEE